MVAVARGRFVMGARNNDPAAEADERPPHAVTITHALAVSQSAVSFAEWDAAAAQGAFGSFVPGDSGWGRLERPVINVSWRDAQAFCSHLSRETGRRYRLLSEAEWEYCCRAGGDGVYPGGGGAERGNSQFRRHLWFR
jgi:formylglycine-generating enzyme required for sulfatase activity